MSRTRSAERGMTLVIVLWTVAALTILVSGLVNTQRAEIRLASSARAQVLSAALGQAAIHQVAQQMSAAAAPADRLFRRAVATAGGEVVVEVMPLTGLIDLNLAPESLLADLLAGPGRLAEPAARALAAALVARRKAPVPRGGTARLEAPEELLSVAGVDFDLFAKIAPLVTTDSAGSGRVHALAAPYDVLIVLARGDADLASRVADDRDAGRPAIDTSRLETAHMDSTVSSRYRFTALVPEPDGARRAVVRDIDLRAARPGGPPWLTLRAWTTRRSGPSAGDGRG